MKRSKHRGDWYRGDWYLRTKSSNPTLEVQIAHKILVNHAHHGVITKKTGEALSEQEKTCVIAITAAIVKAEIIAGGSDSDKEIYWYTREAGYPLAKSMGIFWPNVIHMLNSFKSHFTFDALDRLAEPVWIDIGHPEVIVSEVIVS